MAGWDDPEDWGHFFPRDEDALLRAADANARIERLARRKRRAEARAEAIEDIKAVRKAGLAVKRVVIEGTVLEFGEPEAAKTTLTPLEAWKEKKRARSA